MTRMQRIREKELNWSTKQVSKISGVPEQEIIKLEHHYAKHDFTRRCRVLPHMLDLEKLFGEPLDKLLSRKCK